MARKPKSLWDVLKGALCGRAPRKLPPKLPPKTNEYGAPRCATRGCQRVAVGTEGLCRECYIKPRLSSGPQFH